MKESYFKNLLVRKAHPEEKNRKSVIKLINIYIKIRQISIRVKLLPLLAENSVQKTSKKWRFSS
jgi:hypothetical protein